MDNGMGYKFLVSDGLAEEGLALLKANGEVTASPKISIEDLMVIIPDYDALIVRSRTKVTEAVIEAGKRLKVVGRAGVGVDNINVEAAISRGIVVVNSPLAATTAVAEHTLALMLAFRAAYPQAIVRSPACTVSRCPRNKTIVIVDEHNERTNLSARLPHRIAS
jgi:D-3-phosphoglycerate dehydrogenase / 2-oxoglutarate reductase